MSSQAGSSSDATPPGKKALVPRCCDGRACKSCGEKDSSHDPLAIVLGIAHILTHAAACRRWSYPADSKGRTVGTICYYCFRVFEAKYKCKGYTILTWLPMLGQSQEEHGKVMRFVKMVEDFIGERKTFNLKLPWDDFDHKVLELKEEQVARFQAPPDAYWEYDYYVSKKGDPKTNGLGHQEAERDGKRFVIIPGSQVCKTNGVEVGRVEGGRGIFVSCLFRLLLCLSPCKC